MTANLGTRLRTASIVVALVCLLPITAASQSTDSVGFWNSARSWTVSEENDTFASTDSSYTQGIRLDLKYNYWRDWMRRTLKTSSFLWLHKRIAAGFDTLERSCDPDNESAGSRCGTVSFALGQTMYTPADLRIGEAQYDQRPYAGYLFVGAGLTALFQRSQVSSELQLGVTGPPSFAKNTQSLGHWTWAAGAAKPQGWEHQIETMLHISLVNRYWWRHANMELCGSGECDRTYSENRVFDVTARGEIVAGSIMTRASAGGVARLGYRFPSHQAHARIAPTKFGSQSKSESQHRFERLQPWINAFFAFDARGIGHNAFLSGSIVDRDRNGWNTLKEIDTKHFVHEASYGVDVGLDYVVLTWQRVRRSEEYYPNGGPHRYGSISITVKSPQRVRRREGASETQP